MSPELRCKRVPSYIPVLSTNLLEPRDLFTYERSRFRNMSTFLMSIIFCPEDWGPMWEPPEHLYRWLDFISAYRSHAMRAQHYWRAKKKRDFGMITLYEYLPSIAHSAPQLFVRLYGCRVPKRKSRILRTLRRWYRRVRRVWRKLRRLYRWYKRRRSRKRSASRELRELYKSHLSRVLCLIRRSQFRGWHVRGGVRFWRKRHKPRYRRFRVALPKDRHETIEQKVIRFITGFLDWLPLPQLSRWRTARSIHTGPAYPYVRMSALGRMYDFLSYVKSFIWSEPLSALNSLPWEFEEEQPFMHFVLRTVFRNTFLTILEGNRIIYQMGPGRCGIFKTARARYYIGRVLIRNLLANKKLDILFSQCRARDVHISARGLFIHIRPFFYKLNKYFESISRSYVFFCNMYLGWMRKKERIQAAKYFRAYFPRRQYFRAIRKMLTWPFARVRRRSFFRNTTISPSVLLYRPIPQLRTNKYEFYKKNDMAYFSRRKIPGQWWHRWIRKLKFKWTHAQASKVDYATNLMTFNYSRVVDITFLLRQTRKPYNGIRKMRIFRKRNVSSVRYRRRKKRRGKRRRR